MQSDMLEKCIAISQSHFLYVPYKDLTIDQIYGVDGIGNKASRICLLLFCRCTQKYFRKRKFAI